MDHPVISSLDIYYESLPDIHLSSISKSLNVIYGPNESGKSRIKEFLEWMMFSSTKQFESLSPKYKKDAFKSIEQNFHGSIILSLENENFTFTQRRTNGNIDTKSSSSRFSVEDVTHFLTDDISLDHYRNVFALNLNALTREQSNTLLSEDQVAEVFLSAAQTGSGVSLSALVADLGAVKDELFSDSGNATKRTINKLIKEIQETDKEIRQIRRDQKNALSFDAEIDSLNKRNDEATSSLQEIQEKLGQLNISVNYFDTFQEYEKLSSSQPAEVNTDLVNEIVHIKTLLNQCEHHLGDEKELNQLLSSKVEIDETFEQLDSTLRETLDPEKVSDEVRSHKFRSALEKEKNERQTYSNDLSRAQESFDRENSELALLTKRSEELTYDQEVLENSTTRTNEIEQGSQARPSSKIRTIATVSFFVGLVSAIISGVAGQFIGVAAGGTIAVFGLIVYFTREKEQGPATHVTQPHIGNMELTSIQRELSNIHSQIEHHQKQIENSMEKLKELESARSLKRQSFGNKMQSLGFDSSCDPSQIEMYLLDLEKYFEVRRTRDDITVRCESLTSWFENFYDHVARLQEVARTTSLEKSERIDSLIEAQTWLSALLELANENKVNESNLHDTESKTRQLEKMLVAQFSNIENARATYARISMDDIRNEIEILSEQKTKLEEERNELNREIGALKSHAEHVGQETALQDLLQKRESQKLELEFMHKRYLVASSAYSIAENAFMKCQRESQPEVLKQASHYLSQATRGRWTRVSIELDESSRSRSADVRMTVSGNTTSIDASKLSQGTQEQLYLSLRLALMQTSLRGKHIPALFDDIAVNADKSRFRSIVPLIAEAAQSRQIFYFTCHDWVRDELATIGNANIVNI